MDRREALKAAAVVGGSGILGAAYVTTLDDDSQADSDEPRGTPADVASGTPTDGLDGEVDPGTDSGPPSRTDTPTAVPHGGDFETVVQAREQGFGPDDGRLVNELFEEHVDDGTLLAFEPGTYPIDYFELIGTSGLGVVGVGDEPATFVPAEGQCRGGHPWVSLDGVSDLLVENVVFDFREADSGGPLHLLLEGDAVVRDVRVLGSCSNQIGVCKVEVRDERGSALFERVQARNVGDNQSLTGIFLRHGHAGELTFRECTLGNFSDNGLYASAPGLADGQDGQVTVVGGTYRNNNIANLRLGTTGATVSGARVVVDAQTPGWGAKNARGIRLRNRSGQVIENCEITFGPDAADSFGGVVFHGANGGATVRDTTITIDRASIPAIRAFPVAEAGDGAPTFEDCTIDGSASEGLTARIEGRDGTVFDGCSIEGTGAKRRGLLFRGSTDCRITGSRIDVAEAPVVATESTVTIEDTTVVTTNGERQLDHHLLEDERLTVE